MKSWIKRKWREWRQQDVIEQMQATHRRELDELRLRISEMYDELIGVYERQGIECPVKSMLIDGRHETAFYTFPYVESRSVDCFMPTDAMVFPRPEFKAVTLKRFSVSVASPPDSQYPKEMLHAAMMRHISGFLMAELNKGGVQ